MVIGAEVPLFVGWAEHKQSLLVLNYMRLMAIPLSSIGVLGSLSRLKKCSLHKLNLL